MAETEFACRYPFFYSILHFAGQKASLIFFVLSQRARYRNIRAERRQRFSCQQHPKDETPWAIDIVWGCVLKPFGLLLLCVWFLAPPAQASLAIPTVAEGLKPCLHWWDDGWYRWYPVYSTILSCS